MSWRNIGKDDLDVMLGEPKRAVRSLALALAFSYLIIQLNTYIDTYWTTGLGDVAMSAVAAMSPIYWIVSSIGIGLGVGASSTMAYRIGQGDHTRAGLLGSNAVLLGIGSSMVMGVAVFLLLDPMISLIGADEIRDECFSYAIPFALMSTALVVNGIIAGLLRSEGSRAKSMGILVLSAATNIILDPVLMYQMGMGVAGAGWATCIGSALSCIPALWWYFSGKMRIKLDRSNFRFDVSASKEVLNVGAPRTAEALVTGVTNVLQRIFIVIAGGTMGLMLYNVPFRYATLIVVIAEALGAAMIPVCSAAIGQKDIARMHTGMRYAVSLSFVLTSVLAVVAFVFADPLMGVFINSESMEQHCEELVAVMRMFCIFIPFDGLRKIGSCMLQVVRRSRLSSIAVLVWGGAKLVCYWAACTVSFDALIIAAVAVYVAGGLWMTGLGFLSAKKFEREKLGDSPAA